MLDTHASHIRSKGPLLEHSTQGVGLADVPGKTAGSWLYQKGRGLYRRRALGATGSIVDVFSTPADFWPGSHAGVGSGMAGSGNCSLNSSLAFSSVMGKRFLSRRSALA